MPPCFTAISVGVRNRRCQDRQPGWQVNHPWARFPGKSGVRDSGTPFALARGVDNAISWAVARLRVIPPPGTIVDAAKVGRLVIDSVYSGSLDAVRSRSRKTVSLRRLASHPGVQLNAVALWRSVAICELVSRVPWIAGARHLKLSHVRAVLALPEEKQPEVLRQAETERWSKRRVEAAVAEARRSVATEQLLNLGVERDRDLVQARDRGAGLGSFDL